MGGTSAVAWVESVQSSSLDVYLFSLGCLKCRAFTFSVTFKFVVELVNENPAAVDKAVMDCSHLGRRCDFEGS